MASSTSGKAAARAALITVVCSFLVVSGSPSASSGTCTTLTYTSSDVPKSIPDPGTAESTLALPAAAIADVDARVDIAHSFDSDLRIRLISPSGATAKLAQSVGMWGDNFTGTVFDDEAASSVISVQPPFTGHLRPLDPLSALDGSVPAGTWKLEVKDERSRYTGTLSGWGLDVTTCTSAPVQSPRAPGAPDLPPLPSGVPSGAETTEGTLVTVTNTSETVNGTTTTVAGLVASPGSDGISLPEAITATNNDPGTYTIRFDSSLAGATITLLGIYRLSGGNVFIDGDVNSDGLPSITINYTGSYLPFEIISGGNRLHALTIQGGLYGVNLVSEGNPVNTQPIQRNVLSGLAVNVANDGIISSTGEGSNMDVWSDNRVVGNTIEAREGGIHLGASGKGDTLERTTVAGNRIHLSYAGDGEVTSDAISFDVGGGSANDANHLSDALVAYNTETGKVGLGLAVRSGEVGGKSNVVDGVVVIGNRFEFTAPEGQRPGAAMGFVTGDGASDFVCPDCLPIVYSDGNVLQNVEVRGNSLTTTQGIGVGAACCGNRNNGIQHVVVENNSIQGSGATSGVSLTAGGSGHNEVSDVTVAHNSISIAWTGQELGGAYGGIYLLGSRGNSLQGAIHDVHITDNTVDTGMVGIHLIGGLIDPGGGGLANSGNVVSQIDVRRNVVTQNPIAGVWTYPGAKGIDLTGGLSPTTGNHATGNSVTSVTLEGNTVAGVTDDVSVRSNFGDGASGNLAALGTARPTLTAAKSGGGSGSVTSSPAGIDCGSTCSAPFDDHSNVTLTPTAASGSSFTGWAGACSGTGACTVTMTPSRSVTATFETDKTLTVTKGGSGAGSISSDPAGVDCGATCTHSYAHGTSVTLTASPAAGSSFAGWSGSCTGTDPCTLAMDQNRAATAAFESNKTLTVVKGGHGTGRISSSPSGIDCGSTCSHSYRHGRSVALKATAGRRSVFAGWSGACSGKGACTVLMSANRTVRARFDALCTVPKVIGKTLPAARRALEAANCELGGVLRAFSNADTGKVIAQQPRPGATRPEGAKVSLTVSKGRRR